MNPAELNGDDTHCSMQYETIFQTMSCCIFGDFSAMLQRASTDQKMHQRDTVFQWSPERHAAKIYRIERDFF